MSGAGSFERKIHYVGGLVGPQISNGAGFARGDGLSFLAYTGNRVNLYILDMISNASRSTPGLSIGINVWWMFQGRVPGFENPLLPPYQYRELDQPSTLLETPMNKGWMEPKIIFSELPPAGSDQQYADLEACNYQLPVHNLQPSRVIPLVARADFMFVYFWSNPTSFVGTASDKIYLWAMAGADVPGSQKL